MQDAGTVKMVIVKVVTWCDAVVVPVLRRYFSRDSLSSPHTSALGFYEYEYC